MNSVKSVNDLFIRLNHMNKHDLWEDYEFSHLCDSIGFVSMSRNQSKKFILDQCYNIYNDLENGRYLKGDIILYALNEFAYNRNLKYENINTRSITNTLSLYSNQRIVLDESCIKDIQIKSNLLLKEFFMITECGEPYIYQLIIQDIVSPAFYIKYRNSVLSDDEKNTFLFDKNKAFIRFEKIIRLIDKYYLGDNSKLNLSQPN